MILFRPVGIEELRLIHQSKMQAFPPRLPDQPIFYPVLNVGYARQIARDWNTRSGSRVGFVTRFVVEGDYVRRFERRVVGGREHEELWVPAEQLGEFNRHILGPIEVIETHLCSDCVDLRSLVVSSEDGWVELDPGSSAGLAIDAELSQELGEAHPLRGQDVVAIARRSDCDDVAFFLPESFAVAIVHLTWRRSREPDPMWPRVEFGSVEAGPGGQRVLAFRDELVVEAPPPVLLDYEQPDFPSRARKLIDAARPFVFEVAGESFRQLRPFLKNGQMTDFVGLMARPKVQPFAGVIQFAGIKAQRVRFEESTDALKVMVGNFE